MSNVIRYDPVIVRALADELNGRLAGRRCAALPVFLPGRTVLLPLEGGESLHLELHPSSGAVRLAATPAELADRELDAGVESVGAPADERRLVVRLDAGDRFTPAPREIVVELHGNQWNAIVVDAATGVALTVLWARDAGGRRLRPGEPYAPPPPSARYGAGVVDEAEARARWHAALDGVPAEARAAAIVRGFAYTGALSARILGGDAAVVAEPVPTAAGFEGWWRVRGGERRPVVLELPDGNLPYPSPLPGVRARPAASLLDALATAGAATAGPTIAPAAVEAWIAPVEAALERARRRAENLRRQTAAGPAADELRLRGDLLLARLRLVPRGASSVRVRGWDGSDLDIALDPTLSPAENAAAWYDRARRRERAEQRMPELTARAEADVARWAATLEACLRGDAPDEAAQRALAPAAERAQAASAGAPLPFRRYRTSGGLEVRVGRSAKDNDRLTFGHAAPNDVWLHARSVPGSHVVLRWPDPAGAPPARDLAEAATLAALFSRARSSSLVAVDWTRRKHVRKPRGAAPGSVVPQRVKTVFVEPDEATEERMRGEPVS